jgi:hypothetical protein
MRLATAKAGFFDRQRVIDATTRAERAVLSRFGAFVRQRARTSIRPRRAAAPPGQPPSSHTGLLRIGILFAYDAPRRSVVIGPVRLNSRSAVDIPRRLEVGGTATVLRWGVRRRVTYAPRPFMSPAFASEQQRLPPLWRDSIR